VTIPLDKSLGKHDAKWIRPETPRAEVPPPYSGYSSFPNTEVKQQENRPMMMSGDSGNYFVGYVEEEGFENRLPSPQMSPSVAKGKEPADYFSKMPQSPRKLGDLDGTPSSSGSSTSPSGTTEDVDDTFQYRGRIFVQS
jgi:hypothetical protein